MVTIRLKAGMGNQMFQYAFGLRMARALNTDLRIDLSLLLDRSRGEEHVYRDYDLTIFKVPPNFTIAPTILRNLYKTKSSKIAKLVRKWIGRNKNYIKEPHFQLSTEILNNPKDHTIYEGWWQSEDYFSEIAADIREAFTFVHPILKKSEALLARIKTTNAICLNVRRTDFLKVDTLNTTNKAYFLAAAHRMAEIVEEPVFYIFSDDIAWCRENIVLDYPTELVGHEHKGVKFGNYLQLMIACNHFIIPNSSFAWWAVWLNEHPHQKVIAPKKWFNDDKIHTDDLTKESWIRL